MGIKMTWLKTSEFSDIPPNYCETGILLARNLLRTAHSVVEKVGDWSHDVLHAALDSALEDLLNHRAKCNRCNKPPCV